MAEYTLTEAEVLGTPGPHLIAGEAIAAGDLLYRKSSDNRVYKAQSDGTAEEAVVIGIALSSAAAAGQPVVYQAGGEVTVQSDAFTVVGALLVLGGTPGVAQDAGDLSDGDYVTVIGYSTAANKMVLDIAATGVQYDDGE